MGRHAEGWKLRLDARTGTYTVRFSHQGRRYHRTTGERDRTAAAEAGRKFYAEVIGGKVEAVTARAAKPEAVPLSKLLGLWIHDLTNVLDERTVRSYELYAGAQWIPRWLTVNDIDRAAAQEYVRDRLGSVLRRTLVKELSGLRGFLRWCVEKKHLDEMPLIEQPPRRAVGTADAKRELKRKPIELSSEEVEKILAHLPEWSNGDPRGRRYRVRSRMIFTWETGLRPATVGALRAPDDYRKGAWVLTIREEADKARAGRPMELSARARKVLDAVLPAGGGVIFGPHDVRSYLRAAAKKAKLPAHKADKVSAYDFRHARLTHLAAESGGDLTTLMAVAGHRHASTTSRYIRAVALRTRDLLVRASKSAARPAPLLDTKWTPAPRSKKAKKASVR